MVLGKRVMPEEAGIQAFRTSPECPLKDAGMTRGAVGNCRIRANQRIELTL